MYSKYRTLMGRALHAQVVYAFAASAMLALSVAPWQAAFPQDYSGWSAPINLGSVVNAPVFDGCPSLTRDGRSLLFMSTRAGSNDLYVTHRDTADAGSPWGPPESLGPALNTASNEICPMLTISGRYLFFASDRPGGCGGQDIYVARRISKKSWDEWEAPVNLGCEVNSPGPEFSPSIFEGEGGTVELYFSSGARAGGQGFGDIWVSRLQDDGTFGPASPVLELNTPSNDLRPKIRARDGLEIFFDSSRPALLGQQDIYTSTRSCTYPAPECAWSTPVKVETLAHSTAIDGGAALSFDATELYFMSNRNGGSGDQDIWVSRREKLSGQPE